jgi:hypothetical protein
MAETQGRGEYYDESRIENAAKYAHENGGSDADVQAAARREFGTVTTDLARLIREKMYKVFRR